MAETEMRVWGIHTKDELLFLRNNKIAIGWKEMGNLKDIPANRDDFKAKYVKAYPDAKKGSIPTSVGMLYRFCNEIQDGDYIVYPSKSDHMINIGVVTGEYTYLSFRKNQNYTNAKYFRSYHMVMCCHRIGPILVI